MIGQVLEFVRKHVHNQLLAQAGGAGTPGQDQVVFAGMDTTDITFTAGAISLLLVNLEEDKVLRGPDLYARTSENGARQSASPDIRLVLYMLFVARFTEYDQAWDQLSKIVLHFQNQRVIDAQSNPDLPVGVEKLVMELVTLGFNEQTELWSGLRATYRPSLLYRVKLVAFHAHTAPTAPEVGQPNLLLGSTP
jgi:hypothetical protein